MGQVFLLSLTAALNPVLVGASTVMLLVPNPKRLMVGYAFGALMTSMTLGLVFVFALKGLTAASTTEDPVNPAVDLALGAITLVAALVLGTECGQRIAERRKVRKGPKKDEGPPRWQQALSKGSPGPVDRSKAWVRRHAHRSCSGGAHRARRRAGRRRHRRTRDHLTPGAVHVRSSVLVCGRSCPRSALTAWS